MEALEHSAQFPSVKLKSLINYPTEAQVGKKYLMSIDVQFAEADMTWPYPEEEYEISLQLNLRPFFSYQSLVGNTPTIILHRFGGTYGPAEFILTANTEEVPSGEIKITLRNASGLAIARFELPCKVQQEVVIQSEQKRITVTVPSTETTYPLPTPPQAQTSDVTHPYIEQIEQQLEQVGWTIAEYGIFKDRIERLQVQENSKPLYPSFVAIKSVPYYPNDYALVIRDELVGFVKTQPPDEPLETGAKTVASSSFTRALKISCRHSWIPFVYEATGVKTQITNKLEINPLCRDIYTFHQPETLQGWLDSVPDMFATTNNLFRSRIQNMLPLKKGTLHQHQFEALQQIEQALQQQQQHILIQMETGTSKTYTLIHSIYRLLTYGGAKRILYIVDRPIARQYAMDAFQSIKFTKSDSDHILDDIVSFADLYNVQSLENRKLDSTAQVTVAMLEDIYYLLTDQFPLKSVYNQSDNNTPLPIKYNKNLPIEYFDAIFIVDSEYAYQNRWKSLFLYFDTPIISTTGNPPQEVQEFFPQEFIQAHQKLPATIKSVRDLLRKDAGLSGDADRLPQLTWLLLLKYLDDFELAQEEMHGVGYTPIIEKPYRWRDWVQGESQKDRETGDNLLRFVNNELTPYLQTLSGENNRDIHTIVGTIFKGTFNRMRSGYLLRDVVNKLNTINFNTSNDIHAISLFYETMLKETRDAAGDAGEFYTPRPIIHFIIDRLNPQLGERIMDPACGTAGFLVEAYARIKEQVKTTQQQQLLFDSLIGIEKKPIPYLLGIMNLLLHGIEAPNVVECNALTVNQIPDADQVNIVATNPPFGGEEDPSILDNFPVDIRTHETALLFFQYIMTLLKHPSGRCGIVLPNGFLFGSGIAAKVKETLLREFNLHTIVRLPRGIFAPYTNIPTNILFFETGKDLYPSDDLYPAHDLYPSKLKTNTQEIWYYEIPLPEGRNSYSKTKPIQNEAFQGCIDWWDNRTENEHAWKVPVKEIIADNYNLDRKHPVEMKDPEHFSSVKSLDTIIARERHNITVMESIRNLVEWKKDLIGTTFNQPSEEILLSLISTYCLDALQKAGITQQSIEYISILKSGYRASNSPETHGPLFIRASDINGDNIDWSQVSHKSCSNPNQYILKNSDILIVRSESGIIGRACLIKHVPEQAIFSSSLVRLRLIQDISPEYIYWCLQSQQFWQEITREITGTDIRSITIKAISRLQFPIPSLKTQNILVTYLNNFKDRLQSEKYSELDMQTLLQKIDTFIADNAEL